MIGYYKNTIRYCSEEIQFIRKNKNCDNKRVLELQLFVLRKIVYVEKKIRYYKKLSSSGIGTNEHKNLIIKIYEYRQIRYILRSVGDAIAFIYLNRWDIKPQWQRQDSGFVSGKTGLSKEIKILKAIFEQGEVAILNDITNVIRFGDITHFCEDAFNTLEVKSSKTKNRRAKKQKQKIDLLHDYFRTDVTTKLFRSDYKVIRGASHKELTDNLDRLEKLILNAKATGRDIQMVESGLIYDAAFELNETDVQGLVKMCNEPPIVSMLNIDNDKFTGQMPYILSIRDADAFISFLKGELILTVAIDPSVIRNKLKKSGFQVQFMNDDSWSLRITDNKHQDFYMQVGNHFFNKIFSEFISLDWFINELVFKAKRIIQ